MATPFHFTTVDCPETGLPITVRRMLDPIGILYATNQISQHQRAAAEAFQADVEASSLRAPSRGPSDIGWRSQRPDRHGKHIRRLAKANAALTPDQAKAIKAALAGAKVDIRILTAALDHLAVVYGFATRPTRH